MKEELPFDDFIKEQLSSYSPDVPEHIWNNIAAKRKSKPKGFWINFISIKNIVAIILVALSAGIGGYFLISQNNANNKNVVAKTNVPASQKNESNKIVSEKNIKEDDKINSGNKISIEEKDKFNDPSNASSAPVNTNTRLSSANNFFTSPSSQKNNFNTQASPAENENQNIEILPVVNAYKINKEVLINNLISPFIFNNARELTKSKKINYLNFKLPDCPTIEKNAAGNKKYWEAYAGPDIVSGNYKTFGDTASNNYLQKRKASTKFSSAFSAGVRYTKVFDNGMSVRAGLNFSQINEKFIYFNPNEIKYVTVITTRVVIRQPGDTIYINDTLQYQQSGTRTKATYNHYRTIDIPLVIGYELGNGKIHANINAGVIINLYSWYKGDVLDTLYQPVSITTGKGSSLYQFKNNIGVGFLGSVSFYYKITDKMHLLLEPYFRYNLSPMSKENLNLQQKYNTAGVRAGVRLDLK